ncbi:non-ribosomal peptide synthetase [Aureicoccus marinus]|uniref:Carrier domain-containing protein n=1 Tax=Aureicoccus marinus TaxID=754435 RepID=A0A2S7T5T6_9FLAO|nr:non-ribosomal peptide synthetase [Aureicoccus marinus]PQJ15292.1 hypothetical protein BST99_05685 [Aureicoccus marinus]
MNENKRYQLTATQTQMWLAHQLYPEACVLNVVNTFELENSLDRELFDRSFAELQRQLSVFRLVFGIQENHPYQEVRPEPTRGLDWVECAPNEWKALVDHRKTQPLPIEETVFDACVYVLGEEHYVFYLNMHHSVEDATSSTFIWKALWTLYFGFQESGVFPSLDLIPFEQSLTEYGHESLASLDTQYWVQQSAAHIPQRFYGELSKNTLESQQLRYAIGKERLIKLKTLLKEPTFSSFSEDLGVFTILLTVYVAFLSRITQSEKVQLGIPVHHRSGLKARKSPGLWIEFFPFVTEVASGLSFKELYAQIKSEGAEFFKHALPGSSSAEANRSNQAIFNFIGAGFDNPTDWKVRTNWLHSGQSDPAHGIRCHYTKMGESGEPELWFDLNEALFKEDQRNRVGRHYLKLLDAFLDNVEQAFSEVLLEDSSLPAGDMPQVQEVPAVLGEKVNHFLRQADQIALVEGDQQFTYAQFNAALAELSSQLKRAGLQPGDRVGLCSERSSAYVAAVWTCLREGYVFVPLDPAQGAQRLQFIGENAEVSAILCSAEQEEAGLWRSTPHRLLSLSNQIFSSSACLGNPSFPNPDQAAYILYTSGSTGEPKGVVVNQGALSHYVQWAAEKYRPGNESLCMPFFTSIGFDLTLTSLLTPLATGGKVVVIGQKGSGPDLAVLELKNYQEINTVKLTPAHLQLWLSQGGVNPEIESCILGGEDLKNELSVRLFQAGVHRIYNEYGPTEATVGCIVGEFSPEKHREGSTPIGESVPYGGYLLLDEAGVEVVHGLVGQLYLYGANLAQGYWKRADRTAESFVEIAHYPGLRLYKTGDFARVNSDGDLIYLGRRDEQIKRNGFRIELGEIKSALRKQEGLDEVAIVYDQGESNEEVVAKEADTHCSNCGLPSNYPEADFDEEGVCHLCRAFEGYEIKVDQYFKTEDDLVRLLTSKQGRSSHYDCLALLSGGKDSTYVLARLVRMGLRVLAFTLDNGYISDQAKANIQKIVKQLGVDHVYGSTPHMNTIFVDSLHRHQNVCNGCFKTIYTLSTQIALEKDIPFIVTGLSRGQFFETRLTEELFWHTENSTDSIDKIILEARKLYHQEEDAVKSCLDVSMFREASTFEKVEYVDFYRYSHVSLTQMLQFLRTEIGWERPTDTGRSTNCLINQAGIHVHKKKKGYSNYAFPYSWDVRLGHKNRDESLDEINEAIDVTEVERMLDEIGYVDHEAQESNAKLLAFYTGKTNLNKEKVWAQLREVLPDYMVPNDVIQVEEIPLTSRGKVDRKELLSAYHTEGEEQAHAKQPENDIQALIQEIWQKVLRVESPGIESNFIQLGGHSLAAIRVTAQLNEDLGTELPLAWVFEFPTIESYAEALETHMRTLLEEENS